MKPQKAPRYRGLRGSLSCVRRSLSDVYRGVSGHERQVNEQLVQRLARLRADYNQLRRETNELLRYADKEITQLKRTNEGLAKEYDDLQLRVWELEQQVDELLLYIAQVSDAASTGNPFEAAVEPTAKEVAAAAVNLAHLSLGVVGGHPATQREVINELNLIYGLQRWVVVPPTWENSMGKRVLKGKLERCDLIVIITGYMNHSLTDAVCGLSASGSIAGKVVLLNFRGKSGVVREILKQVSLLEENKHES